MKINWEKSALAFFSGYAPDIMGYTVADQFFGQTWIIHGHGPHRPNAQ